MRSFLKPSALLALMALSACQDGMTFAGPPPTEFTLSRDAAGRCFVRDVSPALVEVVTEQQLVVPEVRDASGRVTQPAIFRNVDRPQVREVRDTTLFEALCPERQTPELVSTLQRALKARGFYRATITGSIDANTARAVQSYQRDFGQDHPALSIASARRLGLIVVDLAETAIIQ
jgi:hypothetical protein